MDGATGRKDKYTLRQSHEESGGTPRGKPSHKRILSLSLSLSLSSSLSSTVALANKIYFSFFSSFYLRHSLPIHISTSPWLDIINLISFFISHVNLYYPSYIATHTSYAPLPKKGIRSQSYSRKHPPPPPYARRQTVKLRLISDPNHCQSLLPSSH